MVEQLRITLASPFISTNRGNSITAKRLKAGYERFGVEVDLIAYDDAPIEQTMAQLYLNQPLHVLHAYRFAAFLEQASLSPPKKMIVTMTGTDHNHDIYHPDRRSKVISILEAASHVILFHEGGKQELIKAVPHLKDKIKVVPQGLIFPSESRDLQIHTKKLLDLKKPGDFIFLLPAGLRAVKNIFYSIPLLFKLRQSHPSVQLWIIGSVLEQDVYDELVGWKAKEPWIHYGGEIPFNDMGAVYKGADVLLNTSVSEGQSSALLEAMAFGKAILACDIPGNRYTISDNQTGMLYKDEEDFLKKATLLVQSDELRDRLGHASKEWVKNVHNPDQEILKYVELLQNAEQKIG